MHLICIYILYIIYNTYIYNMYIIYIYIYIYVLNICNFPLMDIVYNTDNPILW